MNEAARLQMLAAIGVTPLVPRFALQGALASPQCDVEGLDVTAARQSEYAPAISSAAPAVAMESASRVEKPPRSHAPRIDMDIEPVRQDAARSPSATARADVRAESTPRLQVSLVQHHARCFSLLPVYRADFQAEADQFLRAVMLSLGVNAPPLATQVFRWPFANNAKLDLGPAALREALGGFIQHAAREPGSVILLWGIDLAGYLGNDSLQKPGEFALSPTLRAIATYRVQDYFNEPLRKRELWRQVAGLKPVLRGN